MEEREQLGDGTEGIPPHPIDPTPVIFPDAPPTDPLPPLHPHPIDPTPVIFPDAPPTDPLPPLQPHPIDPTPVIFPDAPPTELPGRGDEWVNEVSFVVLWDERLPLSAETRDRIERQLRKIALAEVGELDVHHDVAITAVDEHRTRGIRIQRLSRG